WPLQSSSIRTGSDCVSERDATPDWTQRGHYGAAESGVTFAEATIAAAWNVQGQPTRASFVDALRRLFGVALPLAPNTIATSDALTAVWLAPSSWLLLAGGDSPLVQYAAKRDAVNEAGGALFDASVSRLAWRLSGSRAINVLANGCPLDFHPSAFAAGTCAQSLLGHVGALFVKHDDAPTFTVLVARSFARDAWHALLMSAARHGTEIRSPTPYRGAVMSIQAHPRPPVEESACLCRRQNLEQRIHDAVDDHSDLTRRFRGQIGDASARECTAIVDDHLDASLILQVCDAN